MIRGVIFDLDGVLVSTDEMHFETWRALAEEENIPYDRAINNRMRGVSRMACLEILLEGAIRSYTIEEKTQMAHKKNEHFKALLKNMSPKDVLPGAGRLIKELKDQGIKIAVGSASRNAPLILERLELLTEMDAIADGACVTYSKPHPEVFLTAAKMLGLPPETCLVVEDGAAGVLAARRARMKVLAVGSPDRHPDVKHVAPSLEKVFAKDLLEI